MFLRFQFRLTKLWINLCSLKSAKILKYVPGIYKQFLSRFDKLFYIHLGTVQDCKDISPIQIPLHCPVLMILRTQACNVTLNPALVFYLGILSVDAAIHALIFRQVNRILNLIQAQVPLRTHTKSSYRFLSWQTAC